MDIHARIFWTIMGIIVFWFVVWPILAAAAIRWHIRQMTNVVEDLEEHALDELLRLARASYLSDRASRAIKREWQRRRATSSTKE